MLEQRCAHLRYTVDEMNRAFMELHELALASDIVNWRPVFGEGLRHAMDRFFELVRDSRCPEAEEGEEGEAAQSGQRKRRRSEPGSTSRMATEAQPLSPLDPVAAHGASTMIEPIDMLGYALNYETEPMLDPGVEPHLDPSAGLSWMSPFQPNPQMPAAPQSATTQAAAQPSTTQSEGQREGRTSGPMPDLPRYTESWMVAIPSPSPALLVCPTLPSTYSYQETTFARRLQRDSYEKAYYLLTSLVVPPEVIHHKIRYSLCFNSLEAVTQSIRSFLDRGTSEPLGEWTWPVLNVGGAGTHFASPGKKDCQGKTSHRSSFPPSAPRNYGPWRQNVNAQTQLDPAEFPEGVPASTGLDGDAWFDCHDVEMYLRTRGLRLSGSAPVAEIEIEEPVPELEPPILDASLVPALASPGSERSIDSLNEPSSPPSLAMTTDGVEIVQNNFTLLPPPLRAPHKGKVSTDTLELFDDLPMAGWAGAIASSFGTWTPRRVTRRRWVKIDVGRLLSRLNAVAICLGQSPGYRPVDVDEALEKTIQESW